MPKISNYHKICGGLIIGIALLPLLDLLLRACVGPGGVPSSDTTPYRQQVEIINKTNNTVWVSAQGASFYARVNNEIKASLGPFDTFYPIPVKTDVFLFGRAFDKDKLVDEDKIRYTFMLGGNGVSYNNDPYLVRNIKDSLDRKEAGIGEGSWIVELIENEDGELAIILHEKDYQ